MLRILTKHFCKAFIFCLLLSSLAAQANAERKLFGLGVREAFLVELDQTTFEEIAGTKKPVTSSGGTVDGATGMAQHPVTKEIFAILKVSGFSGRVLGTLDLETGVATLIGSTGTFFAGIAFNADGSILYGVTGDGASPSETLFSIDQTTGVVTELCTLGGGSDGEVIAFNPEDGFLYHWSGRNTNQRFERIDSTVGPSCATTVFLLTPVYDEAFVATWDPTISQFLTFNLDSEFHNVTPGGATTLLNPMADDSYKGLLYVTFDSDDDGLDDDQEDLLGTDPENPDTDGDGVLDGQEVNEDGTDPLESGSFIQRFMGEACTDWNSFLSSFVQIMEIRNASNVSIGITLTMYDIDGGAQDVIPFTLPPSQQRDVILNDLSGFVDFSYGTICAKVTSGDENGISGQLAVYDFANPLAPEFVFSSELRPSLTGNQYMSFNNFFSSLNPNQVGIPTGFVQVSNESDTSETGDLVYYDQFGAEIRRVSFSLNPRTRQDVDVHETGSNIVGLVAWEPTNADKKFRVVQNRYFSETADLLGSLISGAALPARKGSGVQTITAFDSRSAFSVLEVSNVSSELVSVNVKTFDANGSASASQPTVLNIPAMGTAHVILSQFVTDGLGAATIDVDVKSSVLLSLLEYKTDQSGNLLNADSILPRRIVGTEIRSSYNTFLGGCNLRLANRGRFQAALLTMTRSNGLKIVENFPIVVRSMGVTEVDICSFEPERAFGEVSIVPHVDQALTGQVLLFNATGTSGFSSSLRR